MIKYKRYTLTSVQEDISGRLVFTIIYTPSVFNKLFRGKTPHKFQVIESELLYARGRKCERVFMPSRDESIDLDYLLERYDENELNEAFSYFYEYVVIKNDYYGSAGKM